MLRIIVCMKQVIDPEAPASAFQVDTEAKRVIPPKGTPPVLNPFDENALEAALRIKDTQDVRIIVLSMGRNLAKPVIIKSLAAGADELILLQDDDFEELSSNATAYVLTEAIRKAGDHDLILCGRQAEDTDAGQVGSGIAELLVIPVITVARKIETGNGKVRIERLSSDGYEVVEAVLPVLVTASSEIGELRSPSLKDILAAQKKPTTVWSARDLGLDHSQLKSANLCRLFIPPRREANCEIIGGDSGEEAGTNLAIRLREVKII